MIALLFAFLFQTAPELTSPLGKALYAREAAEGAEQKAEKARLNGNARQLLEAAKLYDDAWMFSRSVGLYQLGIERYPLDFRFPRLLGQRYMYLRQFERAVTSLELARKQAPSSLDVAQDLGLAYYLKGDYNRAAEVFGRCLEIRGKIAARGALPKDARSCVELDDRTRKAVAEWQALALRRVPESTSGPYAAAAVQLLEGNKERACDMLRRIVEGTNWSAIDYIAAEAELAGGVCGPPQSRPD